MLAKVDQSRSEFTRLAGRTTMNNKVKLLFVCTHNRCRSILCETIANSRAGDVVVARSAGSSPAGVVHPMTIRYLTEAGYDLAEAKSQSWDAHRDFNPDFVVTVCDSAAGEACPLFLTSAARIHWGLKDPSKLEVAEQIEVAFRALIQKVEVAMTSLATHLREGSNEAVNAETILSLLVK